MDEWSPPRPPAKKLWMITFADLLSLLLTFFVMMFSMTHVHKDTWHAVVETFSQSLNPGRDKPEAATETAAGASKPVPSAARPVSRRAVSLEYLEALLQDKIGHDPVLAQATLSLAEGRLTLSLPADLLFASNSAALDERARDSLFDLGGILANIRNGLGVSGHADPRMVKGGAFASNWELSLARAAMVANALQAAGYDRPITAFGHADTRYGDLPDAFAIPARDGLARRVDIVILPTPSDK